MPSKLHMLVLAAIGSLAAFNSTALAADTITLNDLQVGSELKKGVPYPVVLPITIAGTPHIMNACFRWSGEGPYCFPARYVKSKSRLEVKLRTGNPNTYTLQGYVQYSVNGRIFKTNAKSKKINVR